MQQPLHRPPAREASRRPAWLPHSLGTRGVLIVALAALSVAAPALAIGTLSAARQQRRVRALGEACVALALQSVQAGGGPATSSDDGREALEPDLRGYIDREAANVRWAGLFTADRHGVELRRRSAVPLDTILDQLDFAAHSPRFGPLRVDQVDSDRYLLLSIPVRGGAVLACIVDSGGAEGDIAAAVFLWVGAGVAGLGVSLALFARGVLRPVRSITQRLLAAQAGLGEAALDSAVPGELREALAAVEQTCRELRAVRGEAAYLRRTVDSQVEQKTRHVEKALRQAEHEADTDTLTRLRNRRAFQRDFPALFELHRASGDDLSLIVFDVDNFKEVNDTLGHKAGDELLAFVGELVRASIRAGVDGAYRFGGDEFVLVFPGTGAAAAEEIVRRVRALFAQRARTLVRRDLDQPPCAAEPALSAGIASLGASAAKTADELLHLADESMYRAKRTGAGVELRNARR